MFPFEILREKETGEVDELNQPVVDYQPVYRLDGYLDLITGSDEQAYQNSLLESSSHLFISEDMSFSIESTDRLKDLKTGLIYEITFVDDPMGLGDHYEIYCKRWA